MRAQHIYVNVVLPFMEATKAAGLPAASVARLVEVSRGTPYFWAKQKFMPDDNMQKRLISLTEKINTALESGELPLSIDYDDELRRVLGVERKSESGAIQ